MRKHLKKIRFLNRLGFDTKEALDKIKELHKKIYYTKLACVHTSGEIFHFNIFRRHLF